MSVVIVTGTNNEKFLLNLSANNVYCIYPEKDGTGEYSSLNLVCGRRVVLRETIDEIYGQLKCTNNNNETL